MSEVLTSPDLDIWRALAPDELEREYNARASVPDVDALLRDYRAASLPMYERLSSERNLAYGPHPDERLDLFPVPGRPDAPLFLFVHGGYWRALAKEDSVFMAECFTARGIAVAALDYTLAPVATLETIVDQCRRALVWLHRRGARHIVVGGSSAGGHLAAMLLAPQWQSDAGLPEGVLRGGVLASGLFDLAPVRRVRPNEWLQLDEARARALSPVHQLPPPGTPLCVAAAEHDTAEFRRQSRDYERLCRAQGCDSHYLEVAGRNHFDVIMDWMSPDSALSRATWALFPR